MSLIRISPATLEAAAVAMAIAKAGQGEAADMGDHARMMALADHGKLAEAAIRAAVHPPLPQNLEAEQALLGCVMFDNGVFERLPDGLTASHFHEPFHQLLWNAIDTAVRGGMLAEPTLLADRFSAVPAFYEFGGLRYLADLLDRAPPSANARDYALAVMELSRCRDLLRIGSDLTVEAGDGEIGSVEAAETAEAAIYQVMEAGRSSGQGVITFGQALTGAVDMAAEAFQRDGKLSGLATHLDDLDQKLGGMHPSDLLVLAGRPSMGKTALATNIGFNVARRYRYELAPDLPAGVRCLDGGRVLFFSLEMSAEQLALRILADASGVSSDRVRKGEIRADEFGRIRDAAIELSEIPLFIDATGGLPISKLAARARRQQRKTGLDLIIVDYLQLITVGDRNSNRNRVQEVSEITSALKALAKELGVPILALSQLSRQVENREDKRPQLSDLRESGSIEQDADAVMFVYREAYYLERTEPREGSPEHIEWQQSLEALKHQAEVIVGKQRHGPIGTVKLAFDGDLTRFGNLARTHETSGYRDPSSPQSEYH